MRAPELVGRPATAVDTASSVNDVTEGLADVAAVGVIVVNYGSSALLADNLRTLGCEVPVTVVDNWRGDDERRTVRDLCRARGWHLVEAPANGGWGSGVNLGVRAARRQGWTAAVLLNPDAEMEPRVFDELAGELRRDPGAMVAPRQVDGAGRVIFRGCTVSLEDGSLSGGLPGSSAAAVAVPWLTGGCLGIGLELLERLGGVDERYFLYWEDVDLSVRAARLGARVSVRPDLTVRHDEGGTQDRRGTGRSRTYYYYNCRNRLVFAALLLERRAFLRALLRTPRESWAILLHGGRRQLLYEPSLLLAAARGAVAGVYRAVVLRMSGGAR